LDQKTSEYAVHNGLGENGVLRKRQRYFLIGGMLGVAVLASLAMMKMKPEPEKKDIDTREPLVDVMVLEPLATTFQVRTQGTVRPRTETILSAEVSGTITSISPDFVAGGVFQAGETLMRIDPTNYRVTVDKAEALVNQRQIEFDGAKKLRSQGYRAESELASAAAALASAKAELVRAKRDFERTYIRLPYAGIVRVKETDIGQFVNPGSRLGVVFATDFAEVRLPLTDLDLAFVNLPDLAEITASGDGAGPMVTLTAVQKGVEKKWRAQIVRGEGVVDERSRVTYAVARIEDPYRLHSDGTPLPMGTFVAASIDGSEILSVMRVPQSAVRGSDQLLFIDAENKLRIRKVDIVRSDAEFAYVRGGATAGERVVLTALEAPINGMALRTEADSGSDTSQLASTDDGDDG
jgi:RND family efflux transporter MFP subunit